MYFYQILGMPKKDKDRWDEISRVRLHQTSLSNININPQ